MPMERKIQLCFYDPAWYFLMRWISWCCWFLNYGNGKYCIPRSNINILMPKMSGVWDRIRSLVTSHVGDMLSRSNISHCLCHCFFISHCLLVQRVTSQRQSDKLNTVIKNRYAWAYMYLLRSAWWKIVI